MRRQRPLTSNEKCGYTAAIVVFFIALGVCIFFAVRWTLHRADTYAMNSTVLNGSTLNNTNKHVILTNGIVYTRVARPAVSTTDDDDDEPSPTPLVGIPITMPPLPPLPPLPQAIPLNETLEFIGANLPSMTPIQLPSPTMKVPMKLTPIKQVTRVPEHIIMTNVGL